MAPLQPKRASRAVEESEASEGESSDSSQQRSDSGSASDDSRLGSSESDNSSSRSPAQARASRRRSSVSARQRRGHQVNRGFKSKRAASAVTPILRPSQNSTSTWISRERQFDKFRSSFIVLPVPDGVVRVEKARGYCFHVKSASTWVLPDAIVNGSKRKELGNNTRDAHAQESDEGDEDSIITLGVHVSLFHATTKRFFGNTWVSPELSIDPSQIRQDRDGTSNQIRYVVDNVVLNFRAYFLSEILDPACVGIVELVAYDKDPDSKATVAAAGCGWTILPLFSQSTDQSDAKRAIASAFAIGSSGESVSVFKRNPRVLWELQSPAEWQTQPKHDQCKFYYQLQLYEQLQALGTGGYLRKNELVGALDVIPGLKHGNLAGIDAGTNPKLKLLRDFERDTSDTNDDDIDTYVDALASFVRMAALVPKSIQFEESFSLNATASRAFMHLRTEVESNLVSRLKISRKTLHVGALTIDGHVSARVLKIALHNGRCFRTRHHTVPLKVDQEGDDTMRCASNVTRLKGFVFHPYMAIVVMLQFTVHFRLTWPQKMKQQALEATPKRILPEDDVVTVTMGSRIVVPSDGKKLFLHDSEHLANAIDAPPSQKGYQQRVLHVDLHSGAECRPFSENPIYVPPDHIAGAGRTTKSQAKESFAFVDLHLMVDGEGESTARTLDEATNVESNQKQANGSPKKASHAAEHWAKKILDKADANSVLAQTLNALATTQVAQKQSQSQQKIDSPPRSPKRLDSPTKKPPTITDSQRDHTPVLRPVAPATELSRASRTLLMRYGFVDAHDQQAANTSPSKKPHMTSYQTRNNRSGPTPTTTLEAELNDIYKANEIRFHFAAFRTTSRDASGRAPTVPARVYFTFQFYRFAPTRTETLRLSNAFDAHQAAQHGTQTYLLMRESPANKPSLAIQFNVDTTASQNPLEHRVFSEYMLHKQLYVDVWDADSLFQLGTFVVPLRELLRQGSGIKKFQGEVDVLEGVGTGQATVDAASNEELAFTASDLGALKAPSSNPVGKVQLLMSNYGLKGRYVVPDTLGKEDVHMPRANRAESSQLGTVRAKHRVRARPLVDTNAELYRVLSQEGFYGERANKSKRDEGDGTRRHRELKARSMGDASTLTAKEIDIMCDLFRASNEKAPHSTRIACDRDGKSGLTALLSLKPPISTPEAPRSADATSRPPTSSRRPVSQATVGHSDRLKRVLAAATMSSVDLSVAFQLFDEDKDGYLSHNEFVRAMRSLGEVFADLSDDDLREVVRFLDINCDGKVEYQELLSFMKREGVPAVEDEVAKLRDHMRHVLERAMDKGIPIHRVFMDFDASGDGKLSHSELAQALQQLGIAIDLQPTAKAIMRKMLDQFDKDHDGSISYEEFLLSLGIPIEENKREVIKTTVNDMEAAMREVFQRLVVSGFDLEELFEHFDTDKNGTLEQNEFLKALQQCLQTEIKAESDSVNILKLLERDALLALVKHINKNGDDVVDYHEFLQLCGVNTPRERTKKNPRGVAEKKLVKLLLRAITRGMSPRDIFRQFDGNSDGEVSVKEFEKTLTSLFPAQEKLSVDDIHAISNRFDSNGDGHISLKEFLEFGETIQATLETLTKSLLPKVDILRELDGQLIPRPQWMALCSSRLGLAARKNVDQVTSWLENLEIVDDRARVDVHELIVLVTNKAVPIGASAGTGSDDKRAIGQKLRDFLHLAATKGVDAESSFAHFDADGDGEVTTHELKAQLRALGRFGDVDDAAIDAMVDELDADGSGKISFSEFQQLLPTSTSKGTAASAESAQKRSRDEGVRRLMTILEAASEKGLDPTTCFEHFDKDQDGKITRPEFIAAMKELEIDADESLLSAVMDLVDKDQSGEVSVKEFMGLFPLSKTMATDESAAAGQQDAVSPTHVSNSHDSTEKGIPPAMPTLKDRLVDLLRNAQSHGVEVFQSFAHFDGDGDGNVTTSEFVKGMKALPGFDEVSDAEILEIVKQVDADGSGSLSLEEFWRFLKGIPSPHNSSGIRTDEEKPSESVTDEVPKGGETVKKEESDADGNAIVKQSPASERDGTPVAGEQAKEKKSAPTRSSSFAANRTKPPAGLVARRAKTDSDAVAAERTGAKPKGGLERRPSLTETRAAAKAAVADKDAPASSTGEAAEASNTGETSDVDHSGTLTDPQRPLLVSKPGKTRRPSLAESRAAAKAGLTAGGADVAVTNSCARFDSSDVVGDASAPPEAQDNSIGAATTSAIGAKKATSPTDATKKHGAASQHAPAARRPSLAESRAAAKAKKTADSEVAVASVPHAATALSDAASRGLENLRALLLKAKDKGVSIRDSLNHFDLDGSGQVTYTEFSRGLKHLGPDFASLRGDDVEAMAKTLDARQQGQINLTDFEAFVDIPANAVSVQQQEGSASQDRKGSKFTKAKVAVPHRMFLSTDVHSHEAAMAPLVKGNSKPPVNGHALQQANAQETAVKLVASSGAATAAATTASSESAASCAIGPTDESYDYYRCSYEFNTDPEVRSVEVKLRKAAIDAYSRGIFPMHIVQKFLESGSNRKKQKAELLRVEFLQVLMEMGFSLLSESNQDADDGDTASNRPFPRLNDHLYARQLERLARYKHHIKDETRAQKSLVRAVQQSVKQTQKKVSSGSAQDPNASLHRYVEDKSQLMRVLSYYRDGHKKSLVYSLLRDQVTTQITLFPCFATLLFAELQFVNPYPHQERFRLEFLATPTTLDLDVVKDGAEWRYYRHQLPLAYGLMAPNGAGDVENEMIDPHNEVVLDANDHIPIPMRLRWLQPTTVATSKRATSNSSSDGAPTSTRPTTVSLAVRSCSHGHTVALFKFELYPQPFVCHRVLRFQQPAASVWRWQMRCPPGRFVVCMDPSVAVETNVSDGPVASTVVTFKCRVGAYPSLEEFYVVLYEDEYYARIDEIWQVRIQSTMRLDVHTLLGQTVRSELVIKGDARARKRHVRCFTTWHHAQHISFRPSQIFQLQPDAYNRIEWMFCAVELAAPSLCRVLVHLVDVETQELVGSWMLHVSLGRPTITKTYELKLPVAQSAQKKIAYANPWDQPQTIVLRSSAPQFLRPRDSVLQIPPLGQVFLRLVFPAPNGAAGSTSSDARRRVAGADRELLLFVNDRQTEQNEECLRFQVSYD